MKLDKLTKKLSRDLAANPKKAGLLGLMVLVALYFWFPLITGWFAGAASGPTVPAANVILTDDPIAEGSVARKPKETLKWEKVRQCLENDPWMTPASFDPQWRNPFESPVAQATETAEVATAEQGPVALEPALPPREIGPSDAGLSVGSVAVGPRVRAVTIAGEVYRENDVVVAATEDGERLEFQITKISATEVHFQRAGTSYRLELVRPRLAKGDRIDRGNPGGN